MRVFVRIRIYRICGIFRISFRPARAFRRDLGMDKRLPIEDAPAVKNPENPLILQILILTNDARAVKNPENPLIL